MTDGLKGYSVVNERIQIFEASCHQLATMLEKSFEKEDVVAGTGAGVVSNISEAAGDFEGFRKV